ncbi:MAG: Rpn family recombination-promoting nuclease/putative transposase [Clostridium sp.]|nr:Rpn family recombination-promoting nuclease/putative transposase [Clostridium sp.]
MSKKDSVTSKYLRKNHIFADAFNFFIYGGEQVIDPASLQELDTRGIVVPRDSANESHEPIQRFRDTIKTMHAMFDDHGAYVILAVESQSYINYAMPVRTLTYDAMQYTKQVEEIAATHKLDGSYHGVSGDEYISGFYKSDRILPVITLVIYFADKEWDGPMSLREMFKMNDEHLLSLVQDYKINLIAPALLRDEDFDLFHSSLKEVLLFIKHANNKKEVRELVEKDEAYNHMDRDAVEVINVCTGANLPVREEEETIDMCQGIKEWIEDERAEAAKASAEAAKKEKISILRKSVKALMEKTGMSLEQTLSALEVSQSDQEELMPLL